MQRFGGEWTKTKLEILKAYLTAYTKALKNTPFKTVYIDAFAGTGYREILSPVSMQSQQELFGNEAEAPKAQSTRQPGSARLVLEIEPPFSYYVFVEKSKKKATELENLKTQFPNRNILIRPKDANEYLAKLCSDKQIDWNQYRAVVFLDPFGMTVKWTTLEAIAKTNVIDVWYLFPLGMGVSRLLTKQRSKIGSKQTERLDDIFGTNEWSTIFYSPEHQPLFKDLNDFQASHPVKNASVEKQKRFVMNRFKSLFGEQCVAPKPKVLRNSKNNQMYLLCFAVSNSSPKAVELALRIANSILESPKWQ